MNISYLIFASFRLKRKISYHFILLNFNMLNGALNKHCKYCGELLYVMSVAKVSPYITNSLVTRAAVLSA